MFRISMSLDLPQIYQTHDKRTVKCDQTNDAPYKSIWLVSDTYADGLRLQSIRKTNKQTNKS